MDNMTINEAIQVLKDTNCYGTMDIAKNVILQALQGPCKDCISRQAAIRNVAQIAKAVAKSDKQKSLCGRIIFMLEHMSEVSE